MKQVEAPTHCPSCNYELETVNSVLYCRNVACPAQGAKLIENFAKVLKITGLGPATISKLNIASIEDLYALSAENIVKAIGSALGNKLVANIEKSKGATLNEVLPALGIPLIGKSASEKICANISHISELTDDLANSILGAKAAASLLYWLEINDYESLPFSWEAAKKLKGGDTVCITGKLKSFKTKAQAFEALIAKGFTPVETVTKATKYLVNESGVESAKTEKARANGTIIVDSIEELLNVYSKVG